MRERSRYITVDPDKNSSSEGDEVEMSKLTAYPVAAALDTHIALKGEAEITSASESSIQQSQDKETTIDQL